MTQEYEPIEITKSMKEPTDSSNFFLTDKYDDYRTVATVNENGWYLPGVEGDCSWEWLRGKYIGWRIQSLADHDAQIRADERVKALELSDYELEMLEDARSSSDEWVFGRDIEALKLARPTGCQSVTETPTTRYYATPTKARKHEP